MESKLQVREQTMSLEVGIGLRMPCLILRPERLLKKSNCHRTMNSVTNFQRSLECRNRAHDLIPGGCHTYAKGDDQYPQLSPGFVTSDLGCHVWDVDGNEYIE